MEINEDKIKDFYTLKPIDFPNLVKLSINQELSLPGRSPEINMEFMLSHKNQNEPQQLFINFKGVTNFKFSQPLSSAIQVIEIEIISIEEWQWENTRYKVSEVEDNIFSLMCKEFDATIKTKAGY